MNIYVMASEGGMCKIGFAGNPEKRLEAVANGHPYNLRLARCFAVEAEYAAVIESDIHERLSDRRMCGEWFNVPESAAIETASAVVAEWPLLNPEELTYATDADRAELEQAKQAIIDAKKQRQRVLARIRQRAFRAKQAISRPGAPP